MLEVLGVKIDTSIMTEEEIKELYNELFNALANIKYQINVREMAKHRYAVAQNKD